MKRAEAEEVILCLCGERTVYHYFPDYYAVYLLQRHLRRVGAQRIGDLRKTRWSPLLERPLMKAIIKATACGYLTAHSLTSAWSDRVQPFVLTLGIWGNDESYQWAQTSRPGCNLVLHLNLSRRWSRAVKHMLGTPANVFFGYDHPLSEARDITLAWARLDMDFRTGEVLIEEIQSDLVRHMRTIMTRADRALAAGQPKFRFWGLEFEAKKTLNTSRELLAEYERTWQETMLAASIKFCFDELGMPMVFYNTFETGAYLKNIGGRKPPISIYKQLPKKFCFEES